MNPKIPLFLTAVERATFGFGPPGELQISDQEFQTLKKEFDEYSESDRYAIRFKWTNDDCKPINGPLFEAFARNETYAQYVDGLAPSERQTVNTIRYRPDASKLWNRALQKANAYARSLAGGKYEKVTCIDQIDGRPVDSDQAHTLFIHTRWAGYDIGKVLPQKGPKHGPRGLKTVAELTKEMKALVDAFVDFAESVQ